MDKERINSFDIAKGIGIILVMLGHVLPGESYVRQFIFSFHMPLFFFLSGAVTTSSTRIVKDAVYIQIRKLLINYAFWSGMYLLFDFVANYCILRKIELADVGINLYLSVTFEGIYVLWFLPALITSKIILILLTQKTQNRIYLTTLAISLFFIPIILFESLHIFDKSPFDMKLYALLLTILRNITVSSFALLGFAFRDIVKRITRSPSVVKQALLLLPFVFNLLLCNLHVPIDYFYFRTGVPVLSLSLGVTGTIGVVALSSIIARMENGVAKFWIFLGRNSLFIMATHEYFLLSSLTWMAVFLVLSSANVYIHALLLICLELLLCLTVAPFTYKFTNYLTRRLDQFYENRPMAEKTLREGNQGTSKQSDS